MKWKKRKMSPNVKTELRERLINDSRMAALPSLPALLESRLNCHHDHDHVADGYDVNDDNDSGHNFPGAVNMVINQMAFVKMFTVYFDIVVLIVRHLSTLKTSPQAKRHKPSLLFTSWTILTFITR